MCKKIALGGIIIGIVSLLIFSSCLRSTTKDKINLTVSVAASLKEPMEKIKDEYEKDNSATRC
jgi:molybdate transport system substrate-binding protein